MEVKLTASKDVIRIKNDKIEYELVLWPDGILDVENLKGRPITTSNLFDDKVRIDPTQRPSTAD